MSDLNQIVNKILSNGKGILAADESNSTMTKRLNAVNIESNDKNRLAFRELLFSSQSIKECIGGVILYDETIRQKDSNGISIPELIISNGALPGIKVDTGAKSLAGSKEEKITEGLDGLRERLKEYYELGARFTKWRGVYTITDKYPSKLCISSNAHALARYSALVQEVGMVPIIEPEVLMDGTHDVMTCFKKTAEVLQKCFEELEMNNVDLSGTILKPNMILPGKDSEEKISSYDIAKLTLECLKNNVPKSVPAIAFLSGGQSDIDATDHLNQINIMNDTDFIMSYSYGRALQQSALKFWSKDIMNKLGTQNVFDHRVKMCTFAARGKWSESIENSK